MGTPAPSAAPVRARRARESFFSELIHALMMPFVGKGAMWIPMLAGVLVLAILGSHVPIISRYARILFFAYIGMLANYFARSADAGREGEVQAPELPKFDNFKTQFVFPGLAFLGLTAVLFAAPWYLASKISGDRKESVDRAENAAAESERARFANMRVEDWNRNEVFLNEQGKLVQPKSDDPPQHLKRSDGSWVKVDPGEGVIIYDPPADANAPPRAQPGSEAVGSEPQMPNVPASLIFTLLMSLLLPFYYIPMALTLASFGENVWDIFNPIKVLGAAFRGGGGYVMVVMTGLALIVVPVVVGGKLMMGGSIMGTAVILAGVGYMAAVQGYLMGCLVSTRPDAFPNFN
jgi:hypothetical protein